MASYNRYSHHARRALTHAGMLVTRYRHPRVDTGHLLVGVMLTSGSIGYTVLKEMGLSADKAAPELEALTVALPQSPEVLNNDAALDIALELAADESAWLGHHYIGTEHLLLGITRINVGNASDVLRRLDVAPEQVRRRVRRALNEGMTEFNFQFVRRSARFSELSRRVLSASEQLATTLHHPNAGVGHLLVALLRERRGQATLLLVASGLDADLLERNLEKGDASLMMEIESTLDTALEVAENYSSHYVGTEHLLLSLLVDAASAEIMRSYGVNLPGLYRSVESHLTREGKTPGS